MSYLTAWLEHDRTRPDTITMSLRELDRCKVIEAVVQDGLMVWRAAEKLRERHGIDLAKETVRPIMIDAGLWVPRKQRPPKVHQPRNRRACLGELVQIDGSDHAWFEDRAPACTLLVYVDDATGRLIHRYIEVAGYPDGGTELWADGTSLPYTTDDRFPEVDQSAIVENKRLGHALAIAAEVQSLRDNRRFGAPSRILHGEPPRPAAVPLNVKRQRLVNRLEPDRVL
ncbi:hypothetical protein ACUXG4_005840 [Cupriavidus metallidurans]